MIRFKSNIAERYGVNAAVVAQFLWDSIYGSKISMWRCYHEEKYWCRCSVKMMTGIMPFLTKHMLGDALELLLKNKVIRKGCYNQSGFDKTNWYTFTEFGIYAMRGDEENEKRDG